MAKLLLINADSVARKPKGVQEVGDIVGVFPDTHEFSPTEQVRFEIFYVYGSVEEVRKSLPRVERRDGIDGEVEEWRNTTDNKWYEIKKKKKFEVNVSSLDLEDRQALASSLTSKEDREAAFAKMINKIKEDPSNTSEANIG